MGIKMMSGDVQLNLTFLPQASTLFWCSHKSFNLLYFKIPYTYLFIYCHQVNHTFQLILSTNGEVSFAALIYEDIASKRGQVRFDSGDEIRFTVFDLDTNTTSPAGLSDVNVYRIDGM